MSSFFNPSFVETRKNALAHDNAAFISQSGMTLKEYIVQALENVEGEIYSWIKPDQQEAFEKLSNTQKNEVMLDLIDML